MDITPQTKLIPLLGLPLSQSYSVKLQNEMLQLLGLDFFRFPIETGVENVEEIVRGLRHMNIGGITATKPDKIALKNCCDSLDSIAAVAGAVNCSVYHDGVLKGYNTDGIGFLASLEEVWEKPIESTRVLCLGAGGAGRAICAALAERGVMRLQIADLYEDASRNLVKALNEYFPQVDSKVILLEDREALKKAVCQADVVMNITGLGMRPHEDEAPIDANWMNAGQLAFDAAYNPPRTRFLREAEERGCQVLNGKMMLAYCGMAAFKLLTGMEAPKEAWLQKLDEIERDRTKL